MRIVQEKYEESRKVEGKNARNVKSAVIFEFFSDCYYICCRLI